MIDKDALAQQPRLEGTIAEQKAVVLLSDLTTIGRNPENTLPAKGLELSKNHCRIEKQGEQFLLQNLSSAGTRLNGLWVLSAMLRDGDILAAGRLQLTVRLGALARPKPPATFVPYSSGPLFKQKQLDSRSKAGVAVNDFCDSENLLMRINQDHPQVPPPGDPKRADYDGMQAELKRLRDVESSCKDLCETEKVKDVLPNVAEHMLGVLGAAVGAVLSAGEVLERLAVAKREGLKHSPFTPAAVELAKDKSSPVTSSRGTGELAPNGDELQNTLLAYSLPMGVKYHFVFYCEAAKRPRPYDERDADSLRRLAVAAVNTLEKFDAKRKAAGRAKATDA